jgi:hypothetical protein
VIVSILTYLNDTAQRTTPPATHLHTWLRRVRRVAVHEQVTRTHQVSGMLANLAFPTTTDLREAAWSNWWAKHNLTPSPDQFLTCTIDAFYNWRDEIMLPPARCPHIMGIRMKTPQDLRILRCQGVSVAISFTDRSA